MGKQKATNLTELLRLSLKETGFDTNNGWGFGGKSGVEYKFINGVTLSIGRRHTRHRGTFKVVSAYQHGFPIKGAYDEKSVSPKMVEVLIDRMNSPVSDSIIECLMNTLRFFVQEKSDEGRLTEYQEKYYLETIEVLKSNSVDISSIIKN